MTMRLITTNTSSNAASSSFTSSIDSTYKLYIFKFIDVNPATDSAEFTFQANATDSTSYDETMTTTYFAANADESDSDAGGPSYTTARDQAQGTAYQFLTSTQGNGADESASGTLWLFNPSNTTYVKHFYATMNYYHASDYSANSFISGYFNTTTAIDDIQFKMDSGNFDGTIKMYGVG